MTINTCRYYSNTQSTYCSNEIGTSNFKKSRWCHQMIQEMSMPFTIPICSSIVFACCNMLNGSQEFGHPTLGGNKVKQSQDPYLIPDIGIVLIFIVCHTCDTSTMHRCMISYPRTNETLLFKQFYLWMAACWSIKFLYGWHCGTPLLDIMCAVPT